MGKHLADVGTVILKLGRGDNLYYDRETVKC